MQISNQTPDCFLCRKPKEFPSANWIARVKTYLKFNSQEIRFKNLHQNPTTISIFVRYMNLCLTLMLKPVSLLISTFIILQSFLGLGVMVWFEINKTYIRENLCVNRDQPDLQCNGSCVMKDKLSKVETPISEKEPDAEPVSPPATNFLSLLMYISPETSWLFCFFAKELKNVLSYAPALLPANTANLIKPPQV
jgi:hypothetical protein